MRENIWRICVAAGG